MLTNKIEDQAKNDLFDYDQFDSPALYDPYRNNNILKDSNKPIDSFVRPPYKTFYQASRKGENSEEWKRSQNNRHSLKKLLERLESLPSPDRKVKKIENTKFKTLSIMSSTQPIIIKKKSSIFVRTCTEDVNAETNKQKLAVQATKSQFSSTPKVKLSKLNQQQIQVRRLIKKKLAEKQEFRMKNKTEKLINFLRQNNAMEIAKKRDNNNAKINCRKLINFLT